MRYKREEYFRYNFGEPIPALFKIEKIDGHSVESSYGEADIRDLSPGGLKIATMLKIHDIKRKDIQISARFKLNDEELTIQGIIVWSKDGVNTVEYGIEFVPDQNVAESLIKQLKVYSKRQVQ